MEDKNINNSNKLYYVFNLRFYTDLDFIPKAKTIDIKYCDEFKMEYVFTRVYTDLFIAKNEIKKIINELLETIKVNSVRNMLMDAYSTIDWLDKEDLNNVLIRELCMDENYEGTCIEFLVAE